MRETNLEGCRKILKKHKKYAKKIVETPKSSYLKINRMAYIEENFVNKL